VCGFWASVLVNNTCQITKSARHSLSFTYVGECFGGAAEFMIIDHHRASTSTCTDKRVDVNRCLNITADILFTTSQPFKYTAQHAAIRISDIARLRKEIASIRGGLNQTSGLRKAENGDAETKSSISALHRANLCKAPITRFPFTEIFVTCCCVSSDDNWAVFYSVAGMRKG